MNRDVKGNQETLGKKNEDKMGTKKVAYGKKDFCSPAGTKRENLVPKSLTE